jgi:hypothetical protein
MTLLHQPALASGALPLRRLKSSSATIIVSEGQKAFGFSEMTKNLAFTKGHLSNGLRSLLVEVRANALNRHQWRAICGPQFNTIQANSGNRAHQQLRSLKTILVVSNTQGTKW